MDTELSYKYKSESGLVEGDVTFDKSLIKSFMGIYDYEKEDELPEFILKRMSDCTIVSRGSLLCEGDKNCKEFLQKLKDFWIDIEAHVGDNYEEEFQKLHEFLMEQELVEIKFELY